jgi:hypothetical protein
MFGFPFVTSLIVVTGLVTIFSLIINKGITLSANDSKQVSVNTEAQKSAHI